MEKENKPICFAYFGDGKFLGWYADSFGSVRESSPKIYNYSESQIDTITKNFNYKMNHLAEDHNLRKGHPGLALVDNSLRGDAKILYPRKEVKLKIVECPIYDGPNPDYDKVEANRCRDIRKEAFNKTGIKDIPFGRERSAAVDKFDVEYDGPTYDVPNWIYADYTEVKKWAENEPTEFIGEILHKKLVK